MANVKGKESYLFSKRNSRYRHLDRTTIEPNLCKSGMSWCYGIYLSKSELQWYQLMGDIDLAMLCRVCWTANNIIETVHAHELHFRHNIYGFFSHLRSWPWLILSFRLNTIQENSYLKTRTTRLSRLQFGMRMCSLQIYEVEIAKLKESELNAQSLLSEVNDSNKKIDEHCTELQAEIKQLKG